MTRLARIAAALLALAPPALAQQPQRFTSEKANFTVETVARGLEHPWGLAFLPDGRMIVTERAGRVRIVARDGTLSNAVTGAPRVDARGQGGLLDVALDPKFQENRFVYFSFAEPRDGGKNNTALARAKLSEKGDGLEGLTTIWRQEPSIASTAHFGSRIVFARDGSIFLTVGERYSQRDEAQNPANTLGKIIHLTSDGQPGPGNPGAAKSWNPFIWSIGHRNVQGAALHPVTGQLWTAEHGARGGDEINHPEAGRNYGWPVITYGVDYSGAKIGVGTHKEGMEQPVFYWDPSIAPSGMIFYTGDAFLNWKSSAFVGALAGQLLSRLEFDGDRIVHEERLLRGFGERIRDVRQGPDGLIYLLTDSPQGRVLRLKPTD
ncbi:PQQ-dependent sugar dehydrogenase [Terrarubrum flagellatum]|uniref:PQQ-dependent sugar dehydrogenase n=1 Tax=Terrirubrum flagellatum TaxID=2895980 RepID=UPI003144DD61